MNKSFSIGLAALGILIGALSYSPLSVLAADALNSHSVKSGAATIKWGDGKVQEITLAGTPMLNFTGGKIGKQYVLFLQQDAQGNRTVTWPASVLWPNNTTPTLSTAPHGVDIARFIFDGKNYFGSLTTGYQSSAKTTATIAFDNKVQANTNGSASDLTYSFTTSGSNRILIVHVQTPSTITGVTYGGAAMTQAVEATNIADVNTNVYLFYLKNPASGSNNIVITASDSSHPIVSSAYSFTGASQAGGVDTATYYNSTAESGDITVPLSVSTTNSWIFAAQDSSSILPDSAVNGVFGTTTGLTQYEIVYSNAGVGSGTQSIGYHWSSNDHHSIVVLAFAPL